MTGSVGADARIGSKIAGYRIERLLGRGGMAVVYLAHHERLDRHVALKLIAPELAEDEKFRERFLRESRLAASLDHPNVIPIYDADEADGVLFIAMRYVEGTDFGALLKGDEPVSPERSLAILDRVASALDVAHGRGLVHRDVKPENVLLAESVSGDPEHVYLTDFGLSTRLGDEPDDEDAAGVLGSLDYLAPEQIRDQPVTAQSDVYALGCVLFRALTGEAPFVGRNRLAVLWGHLEKPAPVASERDPDLPGELDPVLTRAMAKEPEERHGSCGALLDETRAALGLEAPGLAEPVPRRRRKTLIVVASLLVVIAVAALVPALLLTGGDDTGAVGDVWTRAPHNESVFGGSLGTGPTGIATTESGLVVVGADNRLFAEGGGFEDRVDASVWTSVDGRDWKRVDDPALAGELGEGMNGVATGASELVAVGTEWDTSSSVWTSWPVVWRSTDGASWERVSDDEPAFEAQGGISAIAARGTGYVAVGGDNLGLVVWTTPDGESWSRVPFDAAAFGPRRPGPSAFVWVGTVAVGPDGHVVAVGSDTDVFTGNDDKTVAAVWMSPDATSWTRIAHDDALFGDGSTAFDLRGVAAGGPGFVAVGAEAEGGAEPWAPFALEDAGPDGGLTAVVLTTEDGLAWRRLPVTEFPDGGRNVQLEAVTTTDAGLVAVGWRRDEPGVISGNVDAVVWTSRDGTTWVEAADPGMVFSQLGGQLLVDVVEGGPGLVAVGQDGDSNSFNTAIWTSP